MLLVSISDIVYSMQMTNTSYRFGNPLLGRLSSPELIAESLRQENLAQHFSVSRIPVREALRQLESEGWIVLERNRGARVSTLSADEVREIYEIRASLEVTALRLAAPRHTPQSLDRAAAILRAAHEADRSLHVQHNREFHLALYAPAGRPRLSALIDSLHSQGERYLRLKLDLPAYKQQSDDEHEQILAAVRSGEIETAVRILEPHLLQTGEMVARYLAEHLADKAPGSGKRRNGVRKTGVAAGA